MPIKRPELINNKVYHIVLRGLEPLFRSEDDYYRGIFSIYEFNDTNPGIVRERRRARINEKKAYRERFSVNLVKTRDKRDRLVDNLAFCLMPNHIHLLLRQVKDNGISDFIRKIGAGYPGYFNSKYDRVGHLFQGKFRAVEIRNIEQLKNALVYIHTNPISLIEPEWKEKGANDPEGAIIFVEDYKWCSYGDYIGKNHFSSVTQRDFIINELCGVENCREFLNEWVRNKKSFTDYSNIAIE